VKCCEITAGMLKEPVTFQRETLTADGSGGTTSAWATIAGAPTRAGVKAMSGGERWASARVEANASWRVTVRYFAGLLPKDRVMIRGKAYNVRFVNNVELADKWLVIDVSEGVAT
jgi:SPP1 family predicted phage head-tail adaptor